MKKIAGGLIIIILLFLIIKRSKKANLPTQQDALIQDSILSLDSRGTDVRRLQMKLNEMIGRAVNEEIPVAYSLDSINFHYITQPLVVDGIFGRATEMMLFALTGKRTIKASEIDSLTISFGITS